MREREQAQGDELPPDAGKEQRLADDDDAATGNGSLRNDRIDNGLVPARPDARSAAGGVLSATPVRSIHFLELRARIDALRGREGLAAFRWTDPELIPGVTPVKLAHLTELRKALDEAYVAGGQSPPSCTDADATAGAAGIRAVQLMELRDAVVALELSDASRTPSSR